MTPLPRTLNPSQPHIAQHVRVARLNEARERRPQVGRAVLTVWLRVPVALTRSRHDAAAGRVQAREAKGCKQQPPHCAASYATALSGGAVHSEYLASTQRVTLSLRLPTARFHSL